MLTRVHVHQHVIRANEKVRKDNPEGDLEPPIIVKTYKGSKRGNTVVIYDADGAETARVIYDPGNPICGGARVWIETSNQVEIVDS